MRQTADFDTLLVAVGNGIERIDINGMVRGSEGAFGVWSKVALSADGRVAAGHNWSDNTLVAWDRRGGRTWLLDSDASGIEAIVVTPDGSFVVAGTLDGLLRVWPLADPSRSHSFLGHDGRVSASAAQPDGRVVSCGEDGWARVWNPQLTAAESSLQLPWTSHHDLVVSGDGRRLAVVSHKGAALVWDGATCRPLIELAEGSVKTQGELNTDSPPARSQTCSC